MSRISREVVTLFFPFLQLGFAPPKQDLSITRHLSRSVVDIGPLPLHAYQCRYLSRCPMMDFVCYTPLALQLIYARGRYESHDADMFWDSFLQLSSVISSRARVRNLSWRSTCGKSLDECSGIVLEIDRSPYLHTTRHAHADIADITRDAGIAGISFYSFRLARIVFAKRAKLY